MKTIKIPAKYYRSYDADLALPYPAEGLAGWITKDFDINPKTTAVLVMHAWDCGSPKEYPGVFRSNEYVMRSYEICRTVLPNFLSAIRQSEFKLYHIVGGRDYYSGYPGYEKVQKIEEAYKGKPDAEPTPNERCVIDDTYKNIKETLAVDAAYGRHNMEDVNRSRQIRDFAEQAKPVGNEPIAQTTEQLFALCLEEKINHLIYTGFALNACLQVSPCGMVDMSRKGLICSVVEDVTCAMETKESIRDEWNKQAQLYGIATLYGLVFQSSDMICAIESIKQS